MDSYFHPELGVGLALGSELSEEACLYGDPERSVTTHPTNLLFRSAAVSRDESALFAL